jgi:hypothetical protein
MGSATVTREPEAELPYDALSKQAILAAMDEAQRDAAAAARQECR